jgi:hypothetical protein
MASNYSGGQPHYDSLSALPSDGNGERVRVRCPLTIANRCAIVTAGLPSYFMRITLITSITVLTLLIAGCSKSDTTATNLGTVYLPPGQSTQYFSLGGNRACRIEGGRNDFPVHHSLNLLVTIQQTNADNSVMDFASSSLAAAPGQKLQVRGDGFAVEFTVQ